MAPAAPMRLAYLFAQRPGKRPAPAQARCQRRGPLRTRSRGLRLHGGQRPVGEDRLRICSVAALSRNFEYYAIRRANLLNAPNPTRAPASMRALEAASGVVGMARKDAPE